MKIGILTFHESNNYCAALQCYALQEVLKSMGHDVWVINYDYRNSGGGSYSLLSRKRVLKNLLNPVALAKDFLRTIMYHCLYNGGFDSFRAKHLRLTEKFHKAQMMPQNFDVYVLGSDQLWSIQCTGWQVEPVFFGQFSHPGCSRIVGYAISANEDSLNMIGADQIRRYAANFDCVSVREPGIAKWLKINNVCDARIDVNPTLLLAPKDWLKITSAKRPCKQRYLLSYYLKPDQKQAAKAFAKRNGLKYIEVGFKAHSPIEFLNWVKHADCVVGGSFHITVFSILFGKPFYTIQKNGSFDIRSASLLKAVGLENRFIPISELPNAGIPSCQYNEAEIAIEGLKACSLEYLESL